jgi:hypothetical protein
LAGCIPYLPINVLTHKKLQKRKTKSRLGKEPAFLGKKLEYLKKTQLFQTCIAVALQLKKGLHLLLAKRPFVNPKVIERTIKTGAYIIIHCLCGYICRRERGAIAQNSVTVQ